MLYIYLPGNAIHGLIKRDFAPPAERLKCVIARLEAVPAMLRALRENVSNPPKEFTDIAIRIASGSIGFFKGMITSWGKRRSGGRCEPSTDSRQGQSGGGCGNGSESRLAKEGSVAKLESKATPSELKPSKEAAL